MSRGNLSGGISLLYHGCYRSNHGINIYIYMDTNTDHFTLLALRVRDSNLYYQGVPRLFLFFLRLTCFSREGKLSTSMNHCHVWASFNHEH